MPTSHELCVKRYERAVELDRLVRHGETSPAEAERLFSEYSASLYAQAGISDLAKEPAVDPALNSGMVIAVGVVKEAHRCPWCLEGTVRAGNGPMVVCTTGYAVCRECAWRSAPQLARLIELGYPLGN